MKIAFFTPESSDGSGSSRFRATQFFETFAAEGIECKFIPFVNEGLKRYYFKPGVGAAILKAFFFFLAFLRRFIDVFKAVDCDLVFIHRNIVPIGPELFAFIVKFLLRKPIVYDFDDAIYLSFTSRANTYIKWVKANHLRTRQNIRLADVVIAGNRTLADLARQFNQNVKIIPTVVDLSKDTYRIVERPAGDRKITIGWTGSYGTTLYIDVVRQPLLELLKRFPDLQVILLGYTGDLRVDRLSAVRWDLESEKASLAQFDIGINPLPDTPFTRGKCGFKIIQYMALGIPSVVSPVGANADILEDGKQGFWARSDEEWLEKLSLLIQDVSLRTRLGRAARERAENIYSINAVKGKYLEIFSEVCEK
ncbi:MAG: glycosyltransferase family 4 protein [Candidatus Saganbacteria bacterium]|nr:glycosyltransferase family 4 protein [Candidatus Saganbacteria bacterium]